MPFDEHNLRPLTPEPERVPPEPSLAFLADVLEDQSRWPAAFVAGGWEYNRNDYSGCGIGLARCLWPTHTHLMAPFEGAGKAFGVPDPVGADIFCYRRTGDEATPEGVARRIRQYLNRTTEG